MAIIKFIFILLSLLKPDPMSRIKKIYIVDDDFIFRQLLLDYLSRSAWFEISSFGTGEDCLAKMMHEIPDLVILDYFLNAVNPVAANGMVILDKILKDFPDMHIIMLSGQGKYGVAASTIVKGAEHYVVKDNDAFGKVSSIIESYN